jgi:hypothetical protein
MYYITLNEIALRISLLELLYLAAAVSLASGLFVAEDIDEILDTTKEARSGCKQLIPLQEQVFNAGVAYLHHICMLYC